MWQHSIHLSLAGVVLCFSASLIAAQSSADTGQPAKAAAGKSTVQEAATADRPAQARIVAYTLPPERAQKAHDLNRRHFRALLLSLCYGILVLWLLIRLRLATTYRAWAERASASRIVQAIVFVPLLMFTIDLLQLPFEIYSHELSLSYGLSIQNWPSWFWDWTKAELVYIIIATIFIWLLYAIIRKSARRWWLYFWFASLPAALFLVFLTPLIIDPLFHKFEPLAQKDPALTAALQKLVQRAGQTIPAERMFWMGAAEKTTTLNAYVTGFGASKRIVVWDTTIAKLSTPQIVFVAGHEMGHYVLQHVVKGLVLGALGLLVAFYLGFRCIRWALSRWGSWWRICGLDDWASLPVLLLLFSLFNFAGSPLAGAVSRHFEHQADQYALEVTHGLTEESGQVGAQAFQVLGDVGLSDPDPHPLFVFLFYDHPPIRDRVQFCLTYDPWSQGRSPAFVK
jgi:Zn-dependent protease with chaperone function